MKTKDRQFDNPVLTGASSEDTVVKLTIFCFHLMNNVAYYVPYIGYTMPGIDAERMPVKVTLDISGSLIESQWGSGNIQGNLIALQKFEHVN